MWNPPLPYKIWKRLQHSAPYLEISYEHEDSDVILIVTEQRGSFEDANYEVVIYHGRMEDVSIKRNGLHLTLTDEEKLLLSIWKVMDT